MICPTCKRDDVAEGRKLCWGCLESALDACKPNWEFGRSRVGPYVPYDWTANGQAKHDRKRGVYRVDRRTK